MNALDHIASERIIAVLRGPSPDTTFQLAGLLVECGFVVIEVTYTVPEAGQVIRSLANSSVHAVIGAGTVTTVEQAEDAIGNGAKFIVSPGLAHDVSQLAARANVPHIAGACTPSEVLCVSNTKWNIAKLFPASFFGPDYLRALAGPFPDTAFIPTGGVEPAAIHAWAKAGAVALGVGSSLYADTTREAVQAQAETALQATKSARWSARLKRAKPDSEQWRAYRDL